MESFGIKRVMEWMGVREREREREREWKLHKRLERMFSQRSNPNLLNFYLFNYYFIIIIICVT